MTNMLEDKNTVQTDVEKEERTENTGNKEEMFETGMAEVLGIRGSPIRLPSKKEEDHILATRCREFVVRSPNGTPTVFAQPPPPLPSAKSNLFANVTIKAKR